MRISALAIAMALVAQPAWAHHKPNHPDFRRDRPAVTHVALNPCGVRNGPHENPGFQAMGRRCDLLRSRLARNPDDVELRERCDRLARAISGRTCSRTSEDR